MYAMDVIHHTSQYPTPPITPASSSIGHQGGGATRVPTKGEKKRMAKKRRLEESRGQQQPGHVQGQGGQSSNKKKRKEDRPKLTKEERRAKFLRPKSSNRPGSHKRDAKVFCFGCRKSGTRGRRWHAYMTC